MPPRGAVLLLTVAAAIATAVVLAEGRQAAPAPQLSAEIGNALTAGRVDDEVLAIATRAVADAERGSDRRVTAAALEQLGQVYSARGQYPDARGVQERALGLWRDVDDTAVPRVLEQLADSQIRVASFDAAGVTIARLRSIREPERSLQPMAFVRMLELEARLRSRRGEYVAAREDLDDAFAMLASTTVGDDLIASLRDVSGYVAYQTGDIQRATVEYEKALVAARRAFGEEHPAIVPYLGKVAITRSAFGDLASARALRVTAVELARARLPACHPASIYTVNDLAISENDLGNYAESRDLLARALSTSRRCLGETHSSTATLLGNLGDILRQLGDLNAAERMKRDALAAWTTNRGPTHQFVALALEGLADVVADAGRIDEARELYERAQSIRVRVVGANDPTVARLLAVRAGLLARQNRFAAAVRDLDRASAIYQEHPPADEPDRLAKTAVQLFRGNIEQTLGHWARARQEYAAVLDAREDLFGSSHPLVAEARTLVASMDLALGATEQAFDEALRAEAASRDHLRRTIRYLTERQALNYASRRLPALDVAVAAAAGGDAAMRRTALDALIRSRAVVLDELAERTRLVHGASASAPDAMARFVSARQRHANLLVQSLREFVPRDRIEAARVDAEDAETPLVEQSAAARAERATANAGLEQVLAALPPHAALVAFVRYDPPIVSASRPSEPEYGAFVVSADGTRTITFRHIGSGPRVESMVRAWRDNVARPPTAASPTPRAIGVALRRLVWDPIAASLGSATRVFIVVDGALSLVNFSALPRAGGGYLVEDDRVMHYLATERDLIAATEPQSPASALIVGGPTFAGQRSQAMPAKTWAQRAGIDCRGTRPLAFTELPGARLEATEISSLFEQTGARDLVVLSGRAATESAVKAAFAGRRIVHLATHGFFLGAGCEPSAYRTRAVGAVVPATAPPARLLNPLQLSGLALAGANARRVASDDDGILTADEIASLDLRGTEWAVLSACNTALGEIRPGEGVLGLRRAFQIAGARTVIMSLWSVDDQATRRWMQALYEARLARSLDTADAVRSASLAVLAERRAAHRSTHPFYWAAFVAAGDWR